MMPDVQIGFLAGFSENKLVYIISSQLAIVLEPLFVETLCYGIHAKSVFQ